MSTTFQTVATKGTILASEFSHSGFIQRKCACEDRPEEDGGAQSVMHRKAAAPASAIAVPPLVHEVLRSPGQPLDPSARDFFEPRFHHDFSHVRVHTDTQAAESAHSVGALAYTVGQDLVFGVGQYSPGSESGQGLIAHELTHVVQQQGSGYGSSHDLQLGAPSTPAETEADQTARTILQGSGPAALTTLGNPLLQRACSSDPQCATGIRGSLRHAVTTAENNPGQKAKTTRREALCTKVPRDPACTGDGHGAPAPQLTSLVKHFLPTRLAEITGIFIDKDIPSQYGAYTYPCGSFTPPLPGSQCTFVPARLEDEARLYNTTNTQWFQYGTREHWLNTVI